MEASLRCGTRICRPWVSGSQLTVLCCQSHWSTSTVTGRKKEGRISRLCFRALLSQCSFSRPQLRCKLRFCMGAAACFHCSLGAIYLSHPIYAMHSGLEHKYPSSYNCNKLLLSCLSHTGSNSSYSEEVILISVIFTFSPKTPLISLMRSPSHTSGVFHWILFYLLI